MLGRRVLPLQCTTINKVELSGCLRMTLDASLQSFQRLMLKVLICWVVILIPSGVEAEDLVVKVVGMGAHEALVGAVAGLVTLRAEVVGLVTLDLAIQVVVGVVDFVILDLVAQMVDSVTPDSAAQVVGLGIRVRADQVLAGRVDLGILAQVDLVVVLVILAQAALVATILENLLADYNSFERVLDCRPHFDQLFKRNGSLDKSFQGFDICGNPESDPQQQIEQQQPEEEGEPQGPHFCEMCCGSVFGD